MLKQFRIADYLLAAVIIVVPLVMHLKIIEPPHDLWMYPTIGPEADIFTYWKAKVLIILAFGLLLLTKGGQANFGVHIAAFAFTICLFFSTIFSSSPYLAMYGAPNYNEGALCWISYLIIMASAATMPMAYFRRLMEISVTAVTLFVVLQRFIPDFFMSPGVHWLISGNAPISSVNTHAYGTLMNPNHLGLYCAMLYPFFFRQLGSWKTLFLLVALSAMAVLARSRAAQLSMAISTGYLLYVGGFKRIAIGWAWFSLALIAATISFTDGRLIIWKRSLKLLWETRVLGAGPGTFVVDFQQGLAPFTASIMDRPHNFYIQVWHSTGMISLFALVLIFILSAKAATLCHRASIIGFCVAAFFTDSMVGVTPLFFAIVGNCWSRKEPMEWMPN